MIRLLFSRGILIALILLLVPATPFFLKMFSRSTSAVSATVYPLKSSANHRFLVDQNNVPFLVYGDSPQGFMAISPTDQNTYLTSRAQKGMNSIWVSLLCSTYSQICPSIDAYGGVPPFTTVNDLSTPNPNYFTLVDNMVNLAAQKGMVVFLDPIETGAWLTTLEANGATKAYNYGAYLGNRYKNFPNIVWLHGNDFQTWSSTTLYKGSTDDQLVQAVANGIKSADPNHIQTVELNYDTSGSLDDPSWAPIIGLDTSYSYYPQYAQTIKEYNRASVPVWFIEGVYEFQGYSGGYLGPYQLRNQEYWTQLSGSTGQLYGNANMFGFPPGWQTSGWESTTGVTQFTYWVNLFKNRAWYNLVPDQNHTVVTSGYGTYSDCCINKNSDYLTAAKTPDGSLVIAYMPTARTITVDMSQLSGPVTAQWYDPTNGVYSSVSGSPFPNTGSVSFTPSANNSAGDHDWVLVLETNPGATVSPLPSSTPAPTPLPTPTAIPTPTPTPTTVPNSITIGETNLLPTDDSGNGNLLVAQQVTLSQTATIRSLSFYVTVASGRLRMGIYTNSNSKPKTLLAQTSDITPSVGWNTAPVTSAVVLTPGTYWLAYLPESNNLHFLNTNTGSAKWFGYTYGALPSNFAKNPTSGTYHWSFYATLTP